jgi:hypothetical protein
MMYFSPHRIEFILSKALPVPNRQHLHCMSTAGQKCCTRCGMAVLSAFACHPSTSFSKNVD